MSRRGWIVVAVAFVAFAGIVVLAGRDRAKVTQSAAPSAANTVRDEPAVVRRDLSDTMAIGSVDAPIVMVEWLDVRCPFCAHFSRDTLPGIIETYIDAGLVRYEIYDVAFFGDESIDGAVAARAAGEQGRYVEFLSAVFDAAPDRAHIDLPRERLIEFAQQAGVGDLERFEADLDRDDLRLAVQRSTSAAGQLGVTTVPFFVIGNAGVSGAQPAEVFHEMIERALAEARG